MSSNKNKVSSDLRPRNQSSPFGTLTNTKHSTAYSPNYQTGQQDILSQAPQNEANLLSGSLPHATQQYEAQLGGYLNHLNSLTADNMVNPQMYNSTYDLLSKPLLGQYNLDTNNLNNELSSKNLLGGSYDALAHGQLNKNLGYNLGLAADNAVNQGLNATNTYLNLQDNGVTAAGNGMTTLGNLAGKYQDLSGALQSQIMNPFQLYTQYQSAVNPLQLQQAQYDWETPTGLQSALGAYGNWSNAIIPGSGAAFTNLGNALGNDGLCVHWLYSLITR